MDEREAEVFRRLRGEPTPANFAGYRRAAGFPNDGTARGRASSVGKTSERSDEMGNNTTVVGAGFGAALGAIVVYLAEILTDTDIPTGVEGAILVVVATLAAYLIPPSRGANGNNAGR